MRVRQATVELSKRGPKSRAWYEACVRHAVRNFSRPHALRRNPLLQGEPRRSLALGNAIDPSGVTALRKAIRGAVEEVISSADPIDRTKLETVLHGAMQGSTIAAIARELSYGREWLHKTWWPHAIEEVTSVFLKRATGEPATSDG